MYKIFKTFKGNFRPLSLLINDDPTLVKFKESMEDHTNEVKKLRKKERDLDDQLKERFKVMEKQNKKEGRTFKDELKEKLAMYLKIPK